MQFTSEQLVTGVFGTCIDQLILSSSSPTRKQTEGTPYDDAQGFHVHVKLSEVQKVVTIWGSVESDVHDFHLQTCTFCPTVSSQFLQITMLQLFCVQTTQNVTAVLCLKDETHEG